MAVNVHEKFALEALLDNHAAHVVVEVTEDIVEIGAPVVGGNRDGFAFTVLTFEDSSSTPVIWRGRANGLWNWSVRGSRRWENTNGWQGGSNAHESEHEHGDLHPRLGGRWGLGQGQKVFG
jgi:hypothetical protein